MPWASAPKAPWVAVWLSPQTMVMPGWVSPCSGPMMWTMPWRGSSTSKSSMPKLRAFSRRVSTWMRLSSSLIPSLRSRVVATLWSGTASVASGRAHLAAGQAQALEGLRAGDLVDQVAVDVEQAGAVVRGVDDMGVPDLVVKRRRRRGGGHGLVSLACRRGAGGRGGARSARPDGAGHPAVEPPGQAGAVGQIEHHRTGHHRMWHGPECYPHPRAPARERCGARGPELRPEPRPEGAGRGPGGVGRRPPGRAQACSMLSRGSRYWDQRIFQKWVFETGCERGVRAGVPGTGRAGSPPPRPRPLAAALSPPLSRCRPRAGGDLAGPGRGFPPSRE